jgi:hypothetical protein
MGNLVRALRWAGRWVLGLHILENARIEHVKGTRIETPTRQKCRGGSTNPIRLDDVTIKFAWRADGRSS